MYGWTKWFYRSGCMAVIILYILWVIAALLIGYDIAAALTERFSHVHIGRWKDEEQWERAVAKVCGRWVVRTPVLRLREDNRYLLLDRLTGKYGSRTVQAWQKAGCFLGLTEEGNSADALRTAVSGLISADGIWKCETANKVDYALLAYAVLKAEKDPQRIRPAMDQVYDILKGNICPDGMISYSAGSSADRRFVDTLGMVCAFLALYGKIYEKPESAALAYEQIRIFHEEGVAYGLPVHCYKKDGLIPLGIYGWGRGAGWYTLALVDVYLEMDADERREQLRLWIQESAEDLMRYERSDGGFSSVLADFGNYDSSATAMLGYFYARCAQIFQARAYYALAVRCRNRLKQVTKVSGVVDGCQGDTRGIGVFSTRYAGMPFAQGMTLRLIHVLNRVDMEWKQNQEQNIPF